MENKSSTLRRYTDADDNVPFEDLPLVGTFCSMCKTPQRRSPGGETCIHGHGGAEPLTAANGSTIRIDTSQVVLTGTVEIVVFAAPDTGFHVLRVRDDTTGKSTPVTGKCSPLTRGMAVRAIGRWEKTAKFGTQLTATSLEAIEAVTDEGLAASWVGLVPGLGLQRARRLVADLGGAERAQGTLDRLNVGNDCPVKWLPQIVFSNLIDAWKDQRTARAVDAQLASFDLPPGLRNKLRAAYGGDAARVVRETPYRLVRDIEGVGFLTADDIAIQIGVGKDSDERIEAAVLYVLDRMAEEEGHTASNAGDISKRLIDLFMKRTVPTSFAKDPLRETTRILAMLASQERVVMDGGNWGRWWSLPRLYNVEQTIATHVQRLLSHPVPLLTESLTEDTAQLSNDLVFEIDRELTDEQRAAVGMAMIRSVSIMTGGPGVGKTTACKEIVRLATLLDLRIELCAPTARAAKRLSEATGHTARTIHRLLEPNPAARGVDGMTFLRNDSLPLDADLILVDESSMVDVGLMASLVQAVPNGARLVFVGDPDQLPPVGPGAPFRDLIASGTVPVTRLTKIHRQAEGSAIVRVAHRIMQPDGYALVANASKSGDRTHGCLHIVPTDPNDVQARIVAIVRDAEEDFQCDPRDVMVIAPMRKGPAGVLALNRSLQAAINPRFDPTCGWCEGVGSHGDIENELSQCACEKEQVPFGTGEHERIFRVGDRVRHTKNDYERGVVNGDQGIVSFVEPHTEIRKTRGSTWVVVDYPGLGGVVYTQGQLMDLQLAYAGTIHSVQGSESPVVILALVDGHRVMLTRTLVYTAITRAKRACLVVGSTRAFVAAASNTKDDKRRTWLPTRLTNTSDRETSQ